MDRLADVELQLILHGLDCKERLQLARCSRGLMLVCDSSFAWKHAPPLSLTRSPRVASAPVTCGRLTRHISISLHWSAPSAVPDSAFSSWMSASPSSSSSSSPTPASLPRLVEYSTSAMIPANVLGFNRFLAHPVMQQLRVLRLDEDGRSVTLLNQQTVAGIVALPLLHTLSICAYEMESATWETLANAPALTSITFSESPWVNDRSRIPLLSQRGQLLQLSVTMPALFGGEFRRAFASPHLAQLQSLTLDCFYAAGSGGQLPVSADDYAAGFSALSHLRSLRLRRLYDLSFLLPHVIHALSLRRLFIDPLFDFGGALKATPILAQIMRESRELRCTLYLNTEFEHAEEAATLKSEFGERFELIIRPEA